MTRRRCLLFRRQCRVCMPCIYSLPRPDAARRPSACLLLQPVVRVSLCRPSISPRSRPSRLNRTAYAFDRKYFFYSCHDRVANDTRRDDRQIGAFRTVLISIRCFHSLLICCIHFVVQQINNESNKWDLSLWAFVYHFAKYVKLYVRASVGALFMNNFYSPMIDSKR